MITARQAAMVLVLEMLTGTVVSAQIRNEPDDGISRAAHLSERFRLEPDLLLFENGSAVEDREDWDRRRNELVELIQRYEYGHLPPRPKAVRIEKHQQTQIDGAIEERMTLVIEASKQLRMRLATYRDAGAGSKPLPVIVREEHALGHLEEMPQIVKRGYMFVEFAREDLAADRADGPNPSFRVYPDYDWATLAAWAWGAMRVMNYLETREDVDVSQVGIVGHSRGGKMALLAGALDERFALVAPNGSGCGGAGCFRIEEGKVETLEMITRPNRFGYWFHPRLREFAGREDELPIDQHFLKALVAPRALICTDAIEDEFANPAGNRATSRAAQDVFDLLGASQKNGLHFREGGHDLNETDWTAILDFADWHFHGRKPKTVTKFRQF